MVDKTGEPPLPSAIRRILYLSQEGNQQEHEVFPPVNPRVLGSISRADAVVFGIGSLYTSICPCLALEEVGREDGDSHADEHVVGSNTALQCFPIGCALQETRVSWESVHGWAVLGLR